MSPLGVLWSLCFVGYVLLINLSPAPTGETSTSCWFFCWFLLLERVRIWSWSKTMTNQILKRHSGVPEVGGQGGPPPPLPSDWGGEGGRRVPLHYEKNDVINIQISLNLRKNEKIKWQICCPNAVKFRYAISAGRWGTCIGLATCSRSVVFNSVVIFINQNWWI